MKLSDKEIILGLLNQQLEKEKEAIISESLDDPGEFSDKGHANTARLVVAIELLERYEWEEDDEEDGDEIPF